MLGPSDEFYLSYETPLGTQWLTKAETDKLIWVIETLDKWDLEAKAKAAAEGAQTSS